VGTAAEPSRARAALREALAIAESLAREGKLNAAQQIWLRSAMRSPSCRRKQPTRGERQVLRQVCKMRLRVSAGLDELNEVGLARLKRGVR
jgi:hypothetical protein